MFMYISVSHDNLRCLRISVNAEVMIYSALGLRYVELETNFKRT